MRPSSGTQTGPLFKALFAVSAWGASFAATKIALGEIAPATMIWLRFAMGTAILLAFVIGRGQWSLPRRGELVYFGMLGFLGITFHQWLQSHGLLTARADTAAWIVASTPIFIALLGWAALGERLSARAAAGIALAAAGVVFIMSGASPLRLFDPRDLAPGDLLILASAPNWAVFSVLSRRGLKKHPSAYMMLWVMGSGWLLSTLPFLRGPGLSDLASLDARGWAAIAFLGIVCSGLAYVFWYDALSALPAARAGQFLFLEPLVAVALSKYLLGEPFAPASLAGGVAILAGVWAANRSNSADESERPRGRSPIGEVCVC